MRVAFVCSSAYQVFNCINIKIFDEEIKKMDADIFLSSEMSEHEILRENLEQESIFDNCFIYQDCKTRWESIPKKMSAIFWPLKHVKTNVVGNFDICDIKYDVIFTSFPRYFSLALSFCVPSAIVYYFEEGTGSYNGDISELPRAMSLLYFLGGHDLKKYKPQRMYVNNLEYCKKSVYNQIIEIPKAKLNDNVINKKIESIFCINNKDTYLNKRIIMLSQPNDEKSSLTEKTNQRVLNVLSEYSDDLLVRLHPRQKLGDIPGGDYKIDAGKGLWEILCKECIGEQSVLIGQFSTAQVTPKLLYNKEPYVIFLYKLYPIMCKRIQNSPYEVLINDLICMYTNRDKIFIPENEAELIQQLNTIMRE